MTRENPTRSDPIAPKQSSGQEERHRSAVAQTLSWAQEAAGCEAVSDALEWLHTVGVVDGALRAAAGRAVVRRAKPESSIELAVRTMVPGYFLAGSK